jgi:hypothetical protein
MTEIKRNLLHSCYGNTVAELFSVMICDTERRVHKATSNEPVIGPAGLYNLMIKQSVQGVKKL